MQGFRVEAMLVPRFEELGWWGQVQGLRAFEVGAKECFQVCGVVSPPTEN